MVCIVKKKTKLNQKFILIGHNAIACDVALKCLKNGVSFHLILKKEFENKRLNKNQTYLEWVQKNDINAIFLETLADDRLAKLCGDMDDCIAINADGTWRYDKFLIDEVFKNKLINCHGTNLPQNRGGNIFTWLILSGMRIGYSLVHEVSPNFDEGPVLAYREFLYPAYCRKPIDYIGVYQEKMAAFLMQIIDGTIEIQKNNSGSQQAEYLSTYWPRPISKLHGWIDWTWSGLEIERFICAFDDPYDGAKTTWNDQTVILRDVICSSQSVNIHPFQSGIVYRKNNDFLCVAVLGYELVVQRIEDENKTSIFNKIKVGDTLFTPADRTNKSYPRQLRDWH